MPHTRHRASIAWLVALTGLVLSGCEPDLPLPSSATPLDERVVGKLEAQGAPGLQAAVLRDGDLAATHAWGWADTKTKRLVDEDTLFTIASVSKLITTVAALRLVDEGELALDEPVDAGFSVAHPTHDAPITLRQLLTHTSSIADNWNVMDPLYTDGEPAVELREFLEGYLRPGGSFFHERNWHDDRPATRYDYSNVGVALVALAVERASGRDFSQYCREEIFDPLGMDATGWFLREVDLERLAVPTTWRRGWNPSGHYEIPDYPSGSLRTTATELGRFLLAATDPEGGLLKPETIDEMLRIQDPALDEHQALAFFWWTLDGEDVVGHDGGDPGVSSEVLLRPSEGDGVVLLANGELSPSAFADIERAVLAE